MKKLIMMASFAVLLLSADLTCAQSVNVSGSVGNGTVSRGRTARASVVMNIPPSLHVNSNVTTSQFIVPTKVTVSGAGVRLGAIRYPRGRKQKFSFADERISVYVGLVAFTFDVKVPLNFKADSISVRVNLRYQACSDTFCYPPVSKRLILTATVR